MNRLLYVTYRCIFLLKCLGSKTCYMVYDWCKVCRAIETNVRETGRVGLGNAFDTYTQRKRKKNVNLNWNLYLIKNFFKIQMFVLMEIWQKNKNNNLILRYSVNTANLLNKGENCIW